MRRALITVVLAGVLVAAGAVPSMAQATGSFDDLGAAGHQGEIVYVTDQGGTKVKGSIVRISAMSIELLVNDGSREWAASDVAWITQRRGHAAQGAWIGLFFGAGSAVILGLMDGYCQNYHYEGCARDDAEMTLFVAALLGGIGAGAGAAIGAAIRTERVLYAAPSRQSAHVFSLPVAPGVIGLRAQLRFKCPGLPVGASSAESLPVADGVNDTAAVAAPKGCCGAAQKRGPTRWHQRVVMRSPAPSGSRVVGALVIWPARRTPTRQPGCNRSDHPGS